MNDNEKKLPKGAGKSSFELVNKDLLKDLLPVKNGNMVLDLACGKGIYSIFLSELIGDEGKIYALDLWEEGIRLLNEKAGKENINNITTIHADGADLIKKGLKDIDTCLMATVLHDFEEVGRAMEVLEQITKMLYILTTMKLPILDYYQTQILFLTVVQC